VSKKTIAFSMPAAAARAPEPDSSDRGGPRAAAAGAQSDDWVRVRDLPVDPAPAPASDALAPPRVILDLTAERTLIEVFALSLIVPFALGWFWWVNALAGRARF